jgi:predicted proteasome-type protease
MSFEDAVKLLMVSFDSTIKANLSVGLPLDLLVIEKDNFEPLHERRIQGFDPIPRNLLALGRGAEARVPLAARLHFYNALQPTLAE